MNYRIVAKNLFWLFKVFVRCRGRFNKAYHGISEIVQLIDKISVAHVLVRIPDFKLARLLFEFLTVALLDLSVY